MIKRGAQLIWRPWEDPLQMPEKDDDESRPRTQKFDAVFSPTEGIIPLNEGKPIGEAFKLYVGYSNFNITKRILGMLDEADGIERLHILSRYRFMVGVGEVFNEEEVLRDVHKMLTTYVDNRKKPNAKPRRKPQTA